MKRSAFEAEVLKLIERNRVVLPNHEIEDMKRLAVAGEASIALETLATQLYEYHSLFQQDVVSEIVSLAQTARLDPQYWRPLLEAPPPGPGFRPRRKVLFSIAVLVSGLYPDWTRQLLSDRFGASSVVETDGRDDSAEFTLAFGVWISLERNPFRADEGEPRAIYEVRVRFTVFVGDLLPRTAPDLCEAMVRAFVDTAEVGGGKCLVIRDGVQAKS